VPTMSGSLILENADLERAALLEHSADDSNGDYRPPEECVLLVGVR
jgi:hypothetical protein